MLTSHIDLSQHVSLVARISVAAASKGRVAVGWENSARHLAAAAAVARSIWLVWKESSRQSENIEASMVAVGPLN